MYPCWISGDVMRLFVFIVAALTVLCQPASASIFPSTYDLQIRQSAERWWPGLDWHLLKAQLYQESRLDPTARSGVGAEGLAQFMPATWAEISQRIGYAGVSRQAAEPAIEGAAYYMHTLERLWPDADQYDKHKLALGSYNAGVGNIRKASRLCGSDSVWDDVSPCIVQITGPSNARQTTGYIVKIFRWFAMMLT